LKGVDTDEFGIGGDVNKVIFREKYIFYIASAFGEATPFKRGLNTFSSIITRAQ